MGRGKELRCNYLWGGRKELKVCAIVEIAATDGLNICKFRLSLSQ